MPGEFEVRNWTKYQHYKDRNPPWIKLYHGLLTSEDWVAADDATRVLLVACLLVASQNGGKVPDNPRHIQRVAYLNSPVDFGPLVDSGFLVPPEGWEHPNASKMLAHCYQDASTMLSDCTQTLAPELREQIQIQRKTYSSSNLIEGVLGDSVPSAEDTKRTGRRLATAARTRESDASFDTFWKRYPRKTNKADARKAWAKIAPDDATLAAILAAVEQDKASPDWRDSGGKFVPYPATWLNDRRWEDEMDAGRNPRAGREAEAGTAKAPGRWAMYRIEGWLRGIGGVPEIGMADALAAIAADAFGPNPFRDGALRDVLKQSLTVEDLKARLAEEKTKREAAERERGEDAYVGEM